MKSQCLCLLVLFSSECLVFKAYGIIGGKPARIEDYPFTVVVMYRGRSIIGSGAILNSYWVVCTANLIVSFDVSDLVLVAGTDGRSNHKVQYLNAYVTYYHGKVSEDSYSKNIALIKTDKKIEFTVRVNSVRLPSSYAKPGTNAQIVGYGQTNDPNVPVGTLHVATVQIIPRKNCIRERTVLCADAPGVGPCHFDFSVPLVQNGELLGLYLGGDQCNENGYPEIYTSIAEMLFWIVRKIRTSSMRHEMEGIEEENYYRPKPEMIHEMEGIEKENYYRPETEQWCSNSVTDSPHESNDSASNYTEL